MASSNEEREERRKRIAERGSDRMALITGRINALPPTPPSGSSPAHRNARHVMSMSVAGGFDSHSEEQNTSSRHQRPQSLSAVDAYNENLSGGSEDKRRAGFSSSRLKHQGGFRYSHLERFQFQPEEEPAKQDSYPITEANNKVSDDSAKVEASPVPSEPKSSVQKTQQVKQPPRHKATFFSSRELNYCILASESTRALSSLIIASVTIAVEENEGGKGKTPGDGHSWGDAVKLLERGLVAYQALRGAFIDCSIYLVVVVCATSFV